MKVGKTLSHLRGSFPVFIHICDGKMHDVNVLDILPIDAGPFRVSFRENSAIKRRAARFGPPRHAARR